MKEKIIFAAMLLTVIGLIMIIPKESEEVKNEFNITRGEIIYEAIIYVEDYGYWIKEIGLNMSNILISVDVTGGKGTEEMHCIDLYVLNYTSYIAWLRKQPEHREQASWFKRERVFKYLSETVDRTGSYLLKINFSNTYYFILDNSGRCAKKVFLKLFNVEKIELIKQNNDNSREWFLIGGVALLFLGLPLLIYGLFSNEKNHKNKSRDYHVIFFYRSF